jgi:hypothetical protein
MEKEVGRLRRDPQIGSSSVRCPVCAGRAAHFGAALVLKDVEAHYFRCIEDCCIFTPEPSWLEQSYCDALSDSDVGSVSRSEGLASLTDVLLNTLFRGVDKCLDYGAGYGMFVRMMRDRGHDFVYWDPHGPNLFAKGFSVASPSERQFDCVTAFEVIEHLERPVDAFRPLAEAAEVMIFSTSLVPDSLPALGDWWYYSLETGQHVTLWRRNGIRRFAAQLGFNAISIGSLHVLSKRPLSRRLTHLLVSTRTRGITRIFTQRGSLIPEDYELVTGKPFPS